MNAGTLPASQDGGAAAPFRFYDNRQKYLAFVLHTMPSEIGDRIGSSTLFAAWNAAIYVSQIEDERLDPLVQNGSYLQATCRTSGGCGSTTRALC
jgi:hypothetical protein